MKNLAIEQQERIENEEFKNMMDDLGLVTIPKHQLITLLKKAYNHYDYGISFKQWQKDNRIGDL